MEKLRLQKYKWLWWCHAIKLQSQESNLILFDDKGNFVSTIITFFYYFSKNYCNVCFTDKSLDFFFTWLNYVIYS